MGSTFRMPVVRAGEPARLFDALSAAGVTVLATIPRGGKSMHTVNLREPVALMLGGEGAGLSHALLEAAGGVVSIPMRGRAESLNVAVAAALLVYEARRQRETREVQP
jgi:TrmH family RNA methyltransferase